MSSKAQLDDPRNASLETQEILPYTWHRESMAGALASMVGVLSSWLTQGASFRWSKHLRDVSIWSYHGDAE